MDNPQHYQPLSHALNPPVHRSPQQYSSFNTSAADYAHGNRREEEEEEEEEVVEEELDDTVRRDGSAHSSPHSRPTAGPAAPSNPAGTGGNQSRPEHEIPEKRRPGRPKGSRNRKPRESGGSTASKSQFHSYPPPPTSAPQLPGVTPQNQQYYEFQWRVLNLCSEFYGAAEELVKGTPPMVIAQSYHMGPSSKVDPLNMLNEAKRICDSLLQNPSQLVGQPPPSVYPAMPYPTPLPPPAAVSAPPSTTSQTSPAPVITNPQTFVMSLGMPGTTTPMYPAMYPPPTRYPTAPYYQYAAPPGYFPPAPPQPQAGTSASAPPQYPSPAPTGAAPSTTATLNMSASNPGGASGAWAEEEVDRLKKLAEDSRTTTASGEIDWDWVVNQWGNSRTRHQILLKATSLGLKESTTRGVKRRREAEATPAAESSTSTAAQNAAAAANPAATLASPAQSHTTASTPSAQPSPAIQYRPPSTQAQPRQASASTSAAISRPATGPPTTAVNMPWPMPTVASATAPVITGPSGESEPQRTSYYRPRAGTSTKAQPSAVQSSHPYIYQTNGAASGSRDGRT
ncbi:hypothetical protein FA95DRAFT_1577176 [Auriscalpium vulgare]|uniref:Uncharacterized protein n=1 Tax=Auriscalpium vulgare TaxID=40419 RepID=A0ACB8R8I7_9AGAM|nr:hypothetical protein FA95DRAFT_1577176 [Auriscalpium vulgare]